LFLGKAFKLPFNQPLESELTPKRNFTEGEFQIVGKRKFKGLFPSITPPKLMHRAERKEHSVQLRVLRKIP